MGEQEITGVFGDFDPAKHEAEAEARWGASPAFAESRRRTKNYTKADWARMAAESAAIVQALATHAAAGKAPGDAECMELAEQHRAHIGRWFYDCTYEIHLGLGELYVADERFAQNYERVRPGLSAFLRDAIVANERRARPGASR